MKRKERKMNSRQREVWKRQRESREKEGWKREREREAGKREREKWVKKEEKERKDYCSDLSVLYQTGYHECNLIFFFFRYSLSHSSHILISTSPATQWWCLRFYVLNFKSSLLRFIIYLRLWRGNEELNLFFFFFFVNEFHIFLCNIMPLIWII